MQGCSTAVLKLTCVERNVADVVGTSAVGAQVGNVDGWEKEEVLQMESPSDEGLWLFGSQR